MHEHSSRSLRGGATGIGLLLGGGAAYLVDRASTEALATTSRALLTTGLAGLVLMAVVVAIRLCARRRGQGDRPPGRRVPNRPMGNLAAELFLVRDSGQLRPVPARVTGVRPHERRRSA